MAAARTATCRGPGMMFGTSSRMCGLRDSPGQRPSHLRATPPLYLMSAWAFSPSQPPCAGSRPADLPGRLAWARSAAELRRSCGGAAAELSAAGDRVLLAEGRASSRVVWRGAGSRGGRSRQRAHEAAGVGTWVRLAAAPSPLPAGRAVGCLLPVWRKSWATLISSAGRCAAGG